MAKSVSPFTWKNGYRQAASGTPWKINGLSLTESGEEAHYEVPGSQELLTSTVHNSLGLNTLRTWPTIYNGTNSPYGIPEWWQPRGEVDVLICGGRSIQFCHILERLIASHQLARLVLK